LKGITKKYSLTYAFILLIIFSETCQLKTSEASKDILSFQDIRSIGRIMAGYIIFVDGNLIKCKNVHTGTVDFQATDATDIILKTINALKASGGGVLLINSSLQLNKQIILDNLSNIKLIGINLPTLAFNIPLEDLSSDRGVSLLIRNCKNIVIEGLDFLYNSDRTAKYIKFRFVNNNITIRNCIFRSRMPPLEPQPESYFVPHDGISLSPTDGAVDGDVHVIYGFVFERNYASGAAVDFIALHNVKNFVIQNNTFIDAAARRWDKMIGNVTNIVGGNCITITGEDGIIRNNVLKRVQQPEIFYNGIYVKHMGGILLTYAGTRIARNIIISNNVFENTKMGVALDPGMENITIADNIMIINASKYGLEDGIAIRGSTKNVRVVSNKVYNSYANGVKIGLGSYAVIVQNNWIDSAQREGIRIEINSTGHQIFGNIIKNNGRDLSLSSTDARRAGIGVRGNNILIINNTIYDDQTPPTQTFGIAIEETASDIYIAGNIIYGNVSADIRNRGENVKIED
jgi:hypothetical protein